MDDFSALGLEEATEEQIDEAISDEDIRGCVDEASIRDGDLKIDGDLSLYDGKVVIVTGNLEVKGNVATDETATLVVGGNLTARHLFLEGNLEVHGNATLRGVVYGFYEAGISHVHGRTTAQIAVIGNHSWECEDERYELDVRFSNFSKLRKGDPDRLRALMGDDGFRKIAKLIGASNEEPPEGNAAWGLGPFDAVAR
ncbi:MAG TPA: hypothetical protein VGH28_33790 [Polyangiaceae bacterium]|jgi:cytoskeletal protein CcmA (bactofilin family)